jgi:hypothetical protein
MAFSQFPSGTPRFGFNFFEIPRVEFRGESLECQFDQMKTMLHKDRVSTLSDVAERA